MSNLIVPGISIGQRLENLQSKLMEMFQPGDVHLQIIRAIVALTDAVPSYKVNLSQLNASSINGQQLVQKNDGFAWVGQAVGIRKAASAAAVPEVLTYHYADKGVFNAVGELDSVQSLYAAGLIGLQIEGKPAMQPLALSYFENPAKVVNSATSGPVYEGYPMDRFMPVFFDRAVSGNTQNYFEVDLSACDTAVIGDAGTNYLVVELIGFRLHNAGDQVTTLADKQNACIV
jgi:hypothetical protein